MYKIINTHLKRICLIRDYIYLAALVLLLLPGNAVSYSEPEVDSIAVFGEIPASESKILAGSGLEVGASLLRITPDEVHDIVVDNLNALGYLTPSVAVEWPSWGETQGIVTLIIDPGQRYIMSGLVIDGISIFPGDSLISLYPASAGSPITPADTSEFCNAIRDAYAERGYIGAAYSVTLVGGNYDSLGNEGSSAFRTIRCTVVEGRQYHLGTVSVSGLETIRPIIVTRELLISPGDSLNEILLQQSMREIYQLGLFRDVRFTYEGADSLHNTVNLLIEVTESEYHIIDIACGYTSPSAIILSASWTDPNIMNNDQKLTLSIDAKIDAGSDAGENEFNPKITYMEPWFLSTRWKWQLELGYLYLHRQGLDDRSWSISSSFARTIWQNLHFMTGCMFEYEKYWESENSEDTNTADWHHTGSLNGAIVHDTRSPVFDPIRGHRYMFSARISGGILGGSDFYCLEAEARKLAALSDRFVIALRGRIGNAFTYGETTSIPPGDRFFLGGGTTIRGYSTNSIGPKDPDGNPLGASDEVLGNLEIRAGIWNNLWIVLFMDTGGLWDTFANIDLDTFALGTGIGFRYITPFGPIRLDYGFAPSHNNSIETGIFYLGLGQAF